MKKLSRAVITGASSGIGEAFANLLASQGVNLVIAARRSEHLNLLAAKLTEKFKVKVEVLPLDLTEEDAPEKLFNFATQNGAPVDLLINNAGAGPYRHFLETSLVDHKNIIQLNLTSLTTLCHLFAGHMIQNKKQSYILNVASIAAYQPVSKFAVYCGTKTYVRLFSEILKFELEDTNVSISCLCPGGTNTEFLEKNNQRSKSGDTFLMSAEKVARIGLDGTLAKKAIIIPGFFNKLTCFFPRFLPNKMNLMLSKNAMALAVEEKDRQSR